MPLEQRGTTTQVTLPYLFVPPFPSRCCSAVTIVRPLRALFSPCNGRSVPPDIPSKFRTAADTLASAASGKCSHEEGRGFWAPYLHSVPPACAGYDFGFVHIKAVDDAGHDRRLDLKVRPISCAHFPHLPALPCPACFALTACPAPDKLHQLRFLEEIDHALHSCLLHLRSLQPEEQVAEGRGVLSTMKLQ